MTPEQRAALDKARGAGPKDPDSRPPGASDDVVAGAKPSGSPKDPPADDPPDDESGFMGGVKQVWRGVGRGVAKDLGFEGDQLSKSSGSTLEEGADVAGQVGGVVGAGLGGEAVLGVRAGALAARLGLRGANALFKPLYKVLPPNMVPRVIHALHSAIEPATKAVVGGGLAGAAADPKHPLEGAATGAFVGAPAGAALRGVYGALPSLAQKAISEGAPLGAIYGGLRASGIPLEHGWPAFFLAHHMGVPLAQLAARAATTPTGAGALSSLGRQQLEGDDGNQP